MKKSNSTILVILGIVAMCAIGFSIYKCNILKQRCDELQGELDSVSSMSESLNSFDCMVISGQDKAYWKCNSEYYAMRHGNGEGKMSQRDYMLYCYIFAIRDGDPGAASEFVQYYLFDIDNQKIAVDTAMLKEAERLALMVMDDTSKSIDPLYKFSVASYLANLYEGRYNKDFSDTLLHQQYYDSMVKSLHIWHRGGSK